MDVEGEHGELPSYHPLDEGFYEANGVMDSVEETEQFGNSIYPPIENTWETSGWGALGLGDANGTTAPPGSDIGSVDLNAISVDGNGETSASKIARDFAGDSDNELQWSDSMNQDHVEHVSAHDSHYDDQPIAEIKVGSDDETETV